MLRQRTSSSCRCLFAFVTGRDHRQTFTTATHHNNNNNSNNRCHYETLGVPRTASPEDVRNAYLEKTKLYHPDKNPDNENTSEKLLRVQEAYESLRNKKKNDVSSEYRQSSAGYGESRWPDHERYRYDRYHHGRYQGDRYHSNSSQNGRYGDGDYDDRYHHDRYRNRELEDERRSRNIDPEHLAYATERLILWFVVWVYVAWGIIWGHGLWSEEKQNGKENGGQEKNGEENGG